MKFRNILPYPIYRCLWGDRRLYDRPDLQDKDWKTWQREATNFYIESQRSKLGEYITGSGYKILKNHFFENKKVLEIGPGDLRHFDYMESLPADYTGLDISESMLSLCARAMSERSIPGRIVLNEDSNLLPFDDEEFDIVLAFNCLEHITDLDDYLLEIKRVLKPKGLLIGAIPNEGGLLWGLGRFLTTRRLVKRKYNFDYDKIICWEHPNFQDKVLASLLRNFSLGDVAYWPISFIKNIDINLTSSFVVKKDV